jgi:hypothetical protein
MAKLNRERALRERRELKQARKAARKLAAATPEQADPTRPVPAPAARDRAG